MTTFSPTPIQRANLAKLAAYLIALPSDYAEEHFDMGQFLTHNGENLTPTATTTICYPCGTSACALGHGPAAGIPPSLIPTGLGTWAQWNRYAAQDFGLLPETTEWAWCFSGHWTHYDNTPQGAGHRIKYLLENNAVPGDFDEYGEIDMDNYDAEDLHLEEFSEGWHIITPESTR